MSQSLAIEEFHELLAERGYRSDLLYSTVIISNFFLTRPQSRSTLAAADPVVESVSRTPVVQPTPICPKQGASVSPEDVRAADD